MEKSRDSIQCPKCDRLTDRDALRKNLQVCPHCDWHFRLLARDRIHLLADGGKFKEIAKRLSAADPLEFDIVRPYRQRIREAERKTGLTEAALAGEALLDGRRVVLICIDFEFMGGTMGSVVGEKVVRAFEWATKKRRPVILVIASGGARLQEGMLALMQMAKTTVAVTAYQSVGLPYISVLTNPSFGGPMASFASLGDILLAEPGAEIGFAGSRVVLGTIAENIPADARRAENLLAHGLIDMVVHRTKLRSTLSLLLSLAAPPPNSADLPDLKLRHIVKASLPAATVVSLARDPQRPHAREYIQRLFTGFVELHGDRSYRDDPAIVGGFAVFHGQTVLIVAQQGGMMPFPEAYRKTRRLLSLAGKFRLPVIAFVDTPGAHPGLEAEYRGTAIAIAECMAAFARATVPIVSVVIGEGGSGGALALGIADAVLMQENAIYSVISPEGAAAILLQDATKSSELSAALKLRAKDLLELGIIDDIVPEPPGGAHLDPDGAANLLDDRLVYHLARVLKIRPRKLVTRRSERFLSMGKFERGWSRLARSLVERVRPESQETKASANVGRKPAPKN